MTKILLVDDDEMVRYSLERYLTRSGYDVTVADDGSSALTAVGNDTFDLVITDIVMPRIEGMELITTLHRLRPDLPIVAISGGGRISQAEYLTTAEVLGVNATLAKPFDPDELVKIVERVLSRIKTKP